MYRVLAVPAGVDLGGFSRHLWQCGIGHRITQQDSQQELWLFDPAHGEQVLQAFSAWQQGELVPPAEAPSIRTSLLSGRWLLGFAKAPVTLAWIVISLVVTGLIRLAGWGELLRLLTFVDFTTYGEYLHFASLSHTLSHYEWWRLFTPMFLHFGLLHLAFNMLWLWEFGRRIELKQHSGWLLVLTLVLSVAANLAQYFSGGALFGGMSGVIYGLLGYCWLWDRLNPDDRFNLNPALVILLLVWLALCISGLVTALGFGNIANAAHVAGLVSGLAMAALASLVRTRSPF